MRRFRTYCLSLALMVAAACNAYAQQHSYVHYDVHDGLAGSTVYAMVQDRQGFIWFATETGLSRYDGTHFQNFTTRDGLPDNEILKVFVDSRNRVWLIPFKNTIAYYWKGSFHTRNNDSVLRKLSETGMIESITEDPAGNIFLARIHRIEKIDTLGRVSLVKPADPLWTNDQIGVGPDGRIKVFDAIIKGYALSDLAGDSLVVRRIIPGINLNNPSIVHLGTDLDIWQEKDSTIFFNPRRNTQFKVPQPKGLISVAYINADGVMLNTIATTYWVDVHRKKITDSFLLEEPVSDAIEDSEGDIWFSTLGKGVFRMGSSYVKSYSFRVGKGRAPVFSIERFHKELYIGTDHYALFRINLRTDSLEGPWLCGDISRGRITNLVVADSQTLILGSDLGVVTLADVQKKVPSYKLLEAIKSLQVTTDNLLLIASSVYVWQYPLKGPKMADTLWRGRATCAYRASDGTCYIGTLKGLYCLKKGNPPIFLGDRWPVFTNRISAICEAPDGLLWIASNGEGLLGYRDGKIVQHITEADGLTSNICRTLLIKGGNIWVGTDKGLNKLSFNGRARTITPFTMTDGLASDMINAVYVGGNDVYVGTSEGLTYFDERNISKRSTCVLQVTGITVSEKHWPEDTTGFMLAHENNNINFQYVGISFKSAGNIVYTYRLLGLDSSWKTTRETFISYPSLPSGNYELQLIATNKFGVRSRMAAVKFSVARLLWEKPWFWGLVALLLALSLVLLFHYRLRRIRMKEAEKAGVATRMAELEQMALRSQMNPHFIFNCLNSIQQYVIYQDVPGANEFISQFSHLIRTTLKISTCDLISLEEEIDYIRTYVSLEKKRFDDKFNYEIVVGPEVDMNGCHIPPMILQPYIENAVRHGIGLRKDSKGQLKIRMEYRLVYLVCTIEDNGVGRKVASQFKSRNAISYQSVGMNLVARRIEMYNKMNKQPVQIHIEDLVDNEGVGSGTRVSILFPLDVVL